MGLWLVALLECEVLLEPFWQSRKITSKIKAVSGLIGWEILSSNGRAAEDTGKPGWLVGRGGVNGTVGLGGGRFIDWRTLLVSCVCDVRSAGGPGFFLF